MKVPKLRISEIFQSIQGESTWAGRVQTFVRLFGCNLDCSYCDTKYARELKADASESRSMFVEEIVKEIEMLGEPKSVCITGGEPLVQHLPLAPLITDLTAKGYHVSLETNGTLSIPSRLVENHLVKIVMDIKCPSSGVDIGKDYSMVTADNVRILRPGIDEVKFVIGSPEDFNFTRLMSVAIPKGVIILLSPVWDQIKLPYLADCIKASQWPWNTEVRMQLQMHKIIWPPEKRGV